MKIIDLQVRNFRAIGHVHLSHLEDVVVIAGPNGCGKSCLLDAIRFFKSAYGSYRQQSELQSWFGEFQVNAETKPAELLALFRDRNQPVSISATLNIAPSERAYLKNNFLKITKERLWAQIQPHPMITHRAGGQSLATLERIHGSRIDEQAQAELGRVLPDLDAETVTATVTILPDGRATTTHCPLLELIFSTFEPNHVGVIDYHGPHRNYSRERLGNVNLALDGVDERMRQHALYDYSNKYSNLKSEMAGEYLRRLLSRQADDQTGDSPESLIDTLKELFSTFFPGKEFLGAQPTRDGRLLFPVRIPSGAQHDIDDLSSGEKEVLYGYLRMRSSAPRNSVLLIDEPELHLNPRLVTGLASFYYRHLGAGLQNQLWLVTHSDTLIRESVARGGFSVFHLQPLGNSDTDEQAVPVRANEELERLVIDLVGDMAAYRPGAKVVVFESSEDAAFDVRMTSTLFPEFERQANCISAGDKRRVANLYELLDQARVAGQLPAEFFVITDPDDDEPSKTKSSRLQWDAYHIENYLLESAYMLRVCHEVCPSQKALFTEEFVTRTLKECAAETIPSLIAHRLRKHANSKCLAAIDLGTDPSRNDIAQSLHEAILRSSTRFASRLQEDLTPEKLTSLEETYRAEYLSALSDQTWLKRFRGRDILKRFVGKTALQLRYELFRDLILARMHDDHFKPPGMLPVINHILGS